MGGQIENPLIFTIRSNFLSALDSLGLRFNVPIFQTFDIPMFLWNESNVKCLKYARKTNYVFRNVSFQNSTLCNFLVLPHRPLKISHYPTFVIAKFWLQTPGIHLILFFVQQWWNKKDTRWVPEHRLSKFEQSVIWI